MSAIVKGPKNGSRKPKEERTTSSTCSAVAMPSSTTLAASLNIANWIRLATKPGPSPTTTAVLPSRRSVSTTDATTRASLAAAGITSTHGTSSGGTNQCTPRKRAAVRSPLASSPIGIDDGLDHELRAVNRGGDRRGRREVPLRPRSGASAGVPRLLEQGEEPDRVGP